MKKTFLLLLAAVAQLSAVAQVPPVIERVDISGIDDSRLSAEVRADIQKLVGQVYSAQAIEALTQDIQVELPEYVAAASTQPGSQPDRVRVVVLVAKISDNAALSNNINERYIVDAIQFEGERARISDDLNAQLQSMVGANVNSAQLGDFARRIEQDNSNSNIYVSWKLQRSAAPQHVNVVYEVRRARSTFAFNIAKGTYHSRQGFGGQIFGLTYTYTPVGTLSFAAFNSADEFIERYAGYRAGYSFGTNSPRLRFTVNYSSFRAQWKTNTLEADRISPQSPGLYRLRDTLSGQLSFRHPLSPRALLGASAQVDFTELQMQTPTTGFQKSNVARGSITYNYSTPTGLESQEFRMSYDGAAGTAAIDSDFIFARHEAKFDYRYSYRVHSIELAFQAGKITGNAPMIERFSIGNAMTLRGWNKYEINPLGGDRMIYGSAAYRYKIIAGFYDVGSVWDAPESNVIRQSVGFRLGKARCRNFLFVPHPDCFSLTVGFPIHGGNAKPSFILGMGF